MGYGIWDMGWGGDEEGVGMGRDGAGWGGVGRGRTGVVPQFATLPAPAYLRQAQRHVFDELPVSELPLQLIEDLGLAREPVLDRPDVLALRRHFGGELRQPSQAHCI